MRSIPWVYFTFSVILVTVKCDTNFEECFTKDSISCLQMKVFNNVRDVFERKSIDFVGGVSLVEEKERKGKNLKDLKRLEESVENATDPRSRQTAIENYLTRKAREVMVTRTIQWNVSETARAIVNAIPEQIKTKLSNYITEGRGKRKKLMKLILPLLIGLKLKMAIVTIISFLGIALLAKKALLAAFISLAISGYIGIKKLLSPTPSTKTIGHDEVYHAQPLWNPPNTAYSNGQWNAYDNHVDYSTSSGTAQHLPYSAHQKP